MNGNLNIKYLANASIKAISKSVSEIKYYLKQSTDNKINFIKLLVELIMLIALISIYNKIPNTISIEDWSNIGDMDQNEKQKVRESLFIYTNTQ